MKPLILFDYDGTLVDSIGTFVDVANSVADRKGYAERLSREELRKLPSRKVFSHLGVPFWKVPFLLKEFFSEYEEHLPRLTLRSDLKELCEELSGEAVLGIVSTNKEGIIREALEQQCVEGLFSVVDGGSFFAKNRHIKKAYKGLDVPKEKVVYVGDETRDVHAARRAKVASCAVVWGLQSEETLVKTRPSMLARSVEELRELLLAFVQSRLP